MSDNIRKVDLVDIELNDGNIHRSFLSHSIGMKDDDGDAFGVRLFRDRVPVDLTGAYVQGYFRNSHGDVIAITNNVISGNTAYVILPKSCYDYDGEFTLSIKVIGGAVTGTMRIVDGTVCNNDVARSIAPASLFNWDAAAKGWLYFWDAEQEKTVVVQNELFGQTAPIAVRPGQKILIANATIKTDYYCVTQLNSNDINNYGISTIIYPDLIGDESIHIYEVPVGVFWISVGFVVSMKDKMYIGVVKTEREGDVTSKNLFDINNWNSGWLYACDDGVTIQKVYQPFFGQTSVLTVEPGDLINIYGAVKETDYMFVTTHNTNDIDDTSTCTKIVPYKVINGLGFAQYTVPTGKHYISVAFVSNWIGKMDIYVAEKSTRQPSIEVSFIGDSITHGFIAPNVWANPTFPEIVGNRLNCKANNYGLSATAICDGSVESFVDRLPRMTEDYIDCLVIFGGTNDYGNEFAHTLGTINDTPARGTNFYAAFKYLIEAAMTKYPMAQILVVTPSRRNNSEANQYGISMEDIVRAEKEVAAYYGVHCYDFYHDSGFNPSIDAQRVRYTSDGLHPNQEGINRFIGPVIATAVDRLVQYRG